ncbi:ABC transporter ATP-binding protein [Micromonospora sp. LH3U1]|uniref:ABC transporter ATP-binding protein n=1 Tax=Micromonospora sp. LH3U1 TaxID=3018339 RepID=UPI00234997BF|nr:ABC transporter ATP-binding protein [Micromonospora sp. LH3U1]WCN79546.1 ABC transporter ATP-binding protein [Micromonospora sp. LH3U1]
MLLQIDGLTKVYRRGVKANDRLSLQVAEGEILALLGHNGSGKTTLVNQVAGLVKPTEGQILLDGHDVVKDPAFARRSCSLQPQAHAPLNGVTPRQAIDTLGRIRGGSRQQVRRRLEHLVTALNIGEWADVPGERLSGGVRRLTAFAMAVVEPGRLVMLDEPTNDVDPVRRRLMWREIRRLATDGCAIILVTHNVAEAERSVDRITVLNHGRIAATGTPAELRVRASGDLLLDLTLSKGQPPALPGWAGPPTVAGNRMVVPVATVSAQQAIEWAQHLLASEEVVQFALNPISLEDIYVGLTTTAKEADDVSMAT